jgi:hypothetical protein
MDYEDISPEGSDTPEWWHEFIDSVPGLSDEARNHWHNNLDDVGHPEKLHPDKLVQMMADVEDILGVDDDGIQEEAFEASQRVKGYDAYKMSEYGWVVVDGPNRRVATPEESAYFEATPEKNTPLKND